MYWTQPYQQDPTLDFFHKYVVTQVDAQDGNATAPTRITTYTYGGDPAWHYDDNELVKAKYRTWGQFRGYGVVETRTGNPTVNVTGLKADEWTLSKSFFHRGMDGDLLPGGGKRSVVLMDSKGGSHRDADKFANQAYELTTHDKSGGPVLSTVVNQYASAGVAASRSRATSPANPMDLPPLKSEFMGQTSSTTHTPITGGWRASSTVTTFDGIGRPTSVTTMGTGMKTSCVKTTYIDNTVAWVRQYASEVKTYEGDCATGTQLRHTRTYYDSQPLGQVTVGDATTVESAKSRDAQGILQYVKSTIGYDTYGRVTSQTAYNPGSSAGNRTTTTVYTPAGTGPVTKTVTTNPKGQTTTTLLEPSRGLKTQVTDVAGRVTSASYDAMGRATQVWKPGQVKGTDLATQKFSYKLNPAAPLAVTSQTLVDPGNGAAMGYVSRTSIFDAFGSLRQAQADGVGGGRVIADTYLDSHGWVVMANDHWFTAGSPATTLVTTASSGIDDRAVNLYDGLGRILETKNYKGTTQVASTKTYYEGDRVTTLPPAGGIATTHVMDPAGRKLEFRQYTTRPTISNGVATGGAYQKQTYTYDALGQQLSMRSGATNLASTGEQTWSWGYDLLGRSTSVTSPDTGTTTTTYYDTGEVAATKDAMGRQVAYDYDMLGRQTGKYANSLTGAKLAAWEYDTLANGVGQLASSTSFNNGYAYKTAVTGYDGLGNPLGSTFTSTDPALSLKASYTMTQTWTKTGLLATRVLPSTAPSPSVGVTAESLKFWYDDKGSPVGLTGINAYVSNATYTPYGELAQLVMGINDQTTGLTYTRDTRTRRVTSLEMTGQTANPQLEQVAYNYDLVGNLNSSTTTQGPDGAPTETQCYSYDGLRQLTQAWSSLDACAIDPSAAGSNATVGGAQPYWTSWTFDHLGNRTQQVQHQTPGSPVADVKTTYTPGDTSGVAGIPPHALASSTTTGGRTGSASYTYNTDGSMKTRTVNGAVTSFSYRADGDLDRVTTATGSSTYIPDADGNTIARRNPDGSTTLYLPGMQAKINAARTSVETTRYYQLGGVQVATRVDKGGVLYLMSDVHGSNQLVVDPVTWSVTRRYLDAYGNPLGGVTGGTWPDDRGFLNKPVNADTGLVDMGAREYDPSTGRFTSVDPILVPDDPQAAHGYVYANNNPMGFSDPTGLMLTVGEGGGGGGSSSSPKVYKTTTSGDDLLHGGRISTVYE